MIFPDGITYDRQKDYYRTITVNPVFELIVSISGSLGDSKKKQVGKNANLVPSVAGTGLEPMTFGL